MRKLLYLLLIAIPAYGQTPYIPVVQLGQPSSGNTCTFGADVTSGNILIVSQSWEATNNTPTVSDTLTSTWNIAINDINPANFIKAGIYVATAASSGADTITFAVSGSGFQWTTCAELPASAWTTTVDASSGVTATGTPASISSGTLTTTMNQDFIWAHVGGTQSGGIFTQAAGFYYGGHQQGHDSAAQEFKITGVNGSYSASFNNSVNSDITLVTIALQPVTIAIQSPTQLPDGALTNAYNYTLLSTGGTGAVTWSITSGSLQSGLSLNASTGAITGTPVSSTTNNITFQVTDGTHTTTKATTLKIGGTLNTPTLVQSKITGSNAGTNNTFAFTSNVTAGNTILIAVRPLTANGLLCTDSVNTIYHLVDIDFVGVTTNRNSINVIAGIAGGSGADTVTCNAGAFFAMSEFSNVQLFGVDNVISNNGTSASPIVSGTLTTLVPNELIYAVDNAVSAGTVLTASAPFTDVGPNFSIDTGYRAVSTVTGYTSSFTMVGNTDGHWNTFLIGLRPSGGPTSSSSAVGRSMVF
jgi:hypothetical protein